MGEQPGPVEDELERALVSMRVGFLSGSSQIAADVASLDDALVDAPEEEREAVRAAVTQIVNTQARLTAKVENLPAVAWDRFKAMVSVVKAQQAVLDQLGDLVQKHVLPRQLENLTSTAFSDAPPSIPDAPPPFPDAPPPPAYEPAPQGESFLRAQSALQALDARRAREARRARNDFPPEDDEEPRSLFARIREWTTGFRGLAAMVVVAVILSLLPRDFKLQDLTAKIVAMVGQEVETAPSGGTDATAEPEPPPPPAAAAQRPAERRPPRPKVAAVTDHTEPDRTDRSAAAASSDEKRAAVPAQALPEAASRPERPASAEPGETPAAAPTVAAKPVAAPASVREEQFVPVVFTHKNYDTVMQAMADLKQRYPNILIGRKGEVQRVNLGKKGIWHRLVFLPAAPRPEASRICEQLMAKGYDRCWVKAY